MLLAACDMRSEGRHVHLCAGHACVAKLKLCFAEADDKNLEIMRKFSEQYAKGTGTYFCSEKSVTSVVIQGLAEHKRDLGYPLCPCRHYDDKALEAEMGYWNCPCTPMRERKVGFCGACQFMQCCFVRASSADSLSYPHDWAH